jgi:hypothetical protein
MIYAQRLHAIGTLVPAFISHNFQGNSFVRLSSENQAELVREHDRICSQVHHLPGVTDQTLKEIYNHPELLKKIDMLFNRDLMYLSTLLGWSLSAIDIIVPFYNEGSKHSASHWNLFRDTPQQRSMEPSTWECGVVDGEETYPSITDNYIWSQILKSHHLNVLIDIFSNKTKSGITLTYCPNEPYLLAVDVWSTALQEAHQLLVEQIHRQLRLASFR